MIIDATAILVNLFINIELNSKKFNLFKKKNNKIQLNHDDIVVAIGIIINPMS